MSLVIPPGFGSAALTFTGTPGTQPYITTIGIDLSNWGGDFVEAANNVMAGYAVGFQNQWSSALVLEKVTLSVGQDGPGGSVDSDLEPIPSTRTGQFPPTAMSAIARKVTNELGRRGRGRMFLPGVISENEVDEAGKIAPARIAAINGYLQTFYDYVVVGDPAPATPMVLLHGPSVTAQPPTPLTGFVCSQTVGWIRGRIR